MFDVPVLQGAGSYSRPRLTAVLAWREGLGLNRTLMRLSRHSSPFDHVLSGRLRREASSGAADVSPSLVAIIILIRTIWYDNA